MNDNELQRALAWARTQNFPSVSARYAKLIVEDRDRLAAERDLAATRIASLHASLEAVQAELSAARIASLHASLEAVQAELSAARADAERYRWLRDANPYSGAPAGSLVELWLFSRPTASVRAIDAAIDAARAAPSARRALDELHQMDHEDAQRVGPTVGARNGNV